MTSAALQDLRTNLEEGEGYSMVKEATLFMLILPLRNVLEIKRIV